MDCEISWKTADVPGRSSGFFSEDILTVVRKGKVRYFMARGNRDKNESIARLYYEIGSRKELGMALHGFAIHKNKTACCVTVPEDDLDARYRLIPSDSLKYLCTTDIKVIEITRNPIKQWWLAILSLMNPRRVTFAPDLPSKYLQFPPV
jgi:hypothetical protein